MALTVSTNFFYQLVVRVPHAISTILAAAKAQVLQMLPIDQEELSAYILFLTFSIAVQGHKLQRAVIVDHWLLFGA